MANLQSQIDILGKAIVREHIKREDEKTEMVAVNDKMLQSHFEGTTAVSGEGDNIKTTTTLSLGDPYAQSHLSAALVNRNIKTGETIDVGIYEEVPNTNEEGKPITELVSSKITDDTPSKIKFHVEDNDEHHVDGFMVINDENLSIENTSGQYTYEVGKPTITKPLKFIGSSSEITTNESANALNKIYIIDSMGNIIPNTSADTKNSITTTSDGKSVYEINNVTFGEELVGGMYRLADMNSDYRSGSAHEINFININIQKPGEGTENQGGEVVQG